MINQETYKLRNMAFGSCCWQCLRIPRVGTSVRAHNRNRISGLVIVIREMVVAQATVFLFRHAQQLRVLLIIPDARKLMHPAFGFFYYAPYTKYCCSSSKLFSWGPTHLFHGTAVSLCPPKK